MSSGATMNYGFGYKEHWRNSIWNRIREALPCAAGDALVVYLAGEKNLDLPIAKRKGFRKTNMIAVEREEKTLKHIRESGQLCINGDIRNVVKSWPSSRKVDVLNLDFCCGLNMDLLDDIGDTICWGPQFDGTVIAANFLRGRDSSSNKWRGTDGSESKLGKEKASLFLDLCIRNKYLNKPEDVLKHRGFWFYIYILTNAAAIDERFYNKTVENLFGHYSTRVRFMTYKSISGQVFDSCVFTSPKIEKRFEVKQDIDTKTKNSISAVLAIRTTRLNDMEA